MSTIGHLIILALGFVAGHLFSRLPAKPLTIRSQPRELVPLVPAIVRKQRADRWVN